MATNRGNFEDPAVQMHDSRLKVHWYSFDDKAIPS